MDTMHMSGQLEQPDRGDFDLATVLGALADPYRLACVRGLARNGETCCSKLHDLTGIECSKSTVSHHMRTLREAGVISTRVSGVHRYSSLRRADLDATFPGLLDAVLVPTGEERRGSEPMRPVSTLASAPGI